MDPNQNHVETIKIKASPHQSSLITIGRREDISTSMYITCLNVVTGLFGQERYFTVCFRKWKFTWKLNPRSRKNGIVNTDRDWGIYFHSLNCDNYVGSRVGELESKEPGTLFSLFLWNCHPKSNLNDHESRSNGNFLNLNVKFTARSNLRSHQSTTTIYPQSKLYI